MFTALNEEVAAGFKLGNDDIKAGYDAVKDVPTTFRPNLNRHSNKDPQRNPVFFNENSS